MSEKIEELKQQAAEAQERAERWERLHTEATIKRELLAAGQQGGAFHAPQLLPFLEPKAKLVEVNGQHVVRVVTTDEQGKEVMHTPAQAVANMKKDGDYANLFRETMVAKSTLAAPVTPEKIDLEKLLKNMSPEQYRKLRAEKPEIFGLKPSPKRGR